MRAFLAASLAAAAALLPQAAAAISGGHPASGREFAFVRLLKISWPDGTTGSCTGSVISERLVLTAAHCVTTDTGEPARGIDVLRKPSDSRGVPATAFHVHAAYQRPEAGAPFRLRNDVAVLVLRDPAPAPYAQTPYDYLYKTGQGSKTGLDPKGSFLREVGVADARKTLDAVMSRDENGRPFAVQIGFGRFGCERSTAECKSAPTAKAKYIQKYIFNYRTDRPIVTNWCDPGPFSLFEKSDNLICSNDKAESTRSPTEHGAAGVYGAQPGDSGGPAVVFDKENRAFVIGTMSYGGFATIAVNMNLVEHRDFLRDVDQGSGPTIRTYPLQVPQVRLSPEAANNPRFGR